MRDIAGNVLSTYEQGPQTGNAIQRTEVPIYGSSRVGTLMRLEDASEDYRYEITDNVGSTRVVFHKPVTETNTETMELKGVSTRAAFQNNNLYRVAYPGAPSGSYVAQFSDSQSPGQEMKRTITVEKGDTITFTAQGLLSISGVASPSARLQPYLLLGATSIANESPASEKDGRPTGTTRLNGNWLARVAAGLSFPIGQRAKNQQTAQIRGITTLQGWIKYRVLDAQGTEVNTRTEYLMGSGTWESLRLGVRVPQAGTIEVIAGSNGQGSAVYFDNLTVEQTGGMIVQEQHQYAYGSPLVGLNYTVGSKQYRNGYQGSFAEKDSETGLESFEARMYSSRIGRWTSADPIKRSFTTPYSGMGNNPVSFSDSDGRDIFIVSTGNGSVLKIQKALKILNATPDGRLLIAEFENNPNRDIYIYFGDAGGDVIQQTYNMDNINMSGSGISYSSGDIVDIANDVACGNPKMAPNQLTRDLTTPIDGLQIRRDTQYTTFIAINERRATSLRRIAFELGHEFGAHIANGEAKRTSVPKDYECSKKPADYQHNYIFGDDDSPYKGDPNKLGGRLWSQTQKMRRVGQVIRDGANVGRIISKSTKAATGGAKFRHLARFL